MVLSQKHLSLCNSCASIAGGGFSSRVHPSQAEHTTLAGSSIHTHHQKVQEIIQKLKMVKNILPTSFLPSHLQRDLRLKAPSGFQSAYGALGTDQQQVCGAHHKPLHPPVCTHLDGSGALPDPSTPHRGCHPWAGGLSLQSPGAEVSGTQVGTRRHLDHHFQVSSWVHTNLPTGSCSV